MLQKFTVVPGFCLAIHLFALSFGAWAQESAKVYHIGFLSPAKGSGVLDILRKRLHELGYVEGKNAVIDARWAETQPEHLPALAAELAALKPDVIVSATTTATQAAKQATTTTPIVMVEVSDPVGSGFVASLGRPAGNITGVTDYDGAAKSVELIRALIPKAARIAVLMSDNPVHPRQLKAIEDAARGAGIAVLPAMDRSPEELEEAFEVMIRANAQALIVLGDFRHGNLSKRIIVLAARAQLPTIYPARHHVEKGGLLSIGSDYRAEWRLAADYVDKILRGAKPGDLPIQQPTKIELTINLNTAKALGLPIPPLLRLRADELIQ